MSESAPVRWRTWILRSPVVGLSAGRIVAAVVSAVWLVVAARQLSLTAYGDFTQVISLSVILTASADLGLSMLLAHDVARWPGASRAALHRVVVARLALGVPACLLMALLYWAAAADPSALVVALAAISMLATMVHQSVSVAARGLGNVRPEAVNEVVSRVFVLAAGFAVLSSSGSVAAAVGVYAVADLASTVALSWWSRRALPARDSARPLPLSLSRVAVLGVTVAAMTMYTRADIWLLGVFSSSAQVARYAAPYRIFEGVLLVAGVAAALTPPVIARATWREMAGGLRRLLVGAVGVTTMVALAGIVLAEPMLEVLYGSRYDGTAMTLRILLVAAVPSAVVLVLLQAAGLLDRAGTAAVVVVALVLNVGGNVIAIPSSGIEGAASVTLATQVLLALGLAVVVARASRVPRSPEALLKAETAEFSDELAVPSLIAE